MKKLLENIIRRRNPAFHFDQNLNSGAIIQFAFLQAMGIFRSLRLLFYGRSPKLMICGRGVRFFNVSKIHWGKFLKLGDQVYLSGLASDGLYFGNNVGIGAHSRVIVSTSLNDIGSFIKIGNNVGIGEFAYLGGAGGLEIGDDCIVGQYLSCHPENHLYADTTQLIREQGISRKGIRIGANCWIGSKVTILDGVEIGEGSVIAAGSVVTKSMPAFSVIGGVPAKILKSRLSNSNETYNQIIKKTA